MNPEIQKQIHECVQAIRSGGFVIFPSEIGWSIGCDAGDSENVSAILQSTAYNTHSVLLGDVGNLVKYVKDFPDAGYDLITFAKRPLHIIIDEPLYTPSSAFKKFKSFTLRIVKDEFTIEFIRKLGKPLFAACLNSPEQPVKTTSVLNKFCFVVNLRASAKANPAQLAVFKFLPGGKIEIIRK